MSHPTAFQLYKRLLRTTRPYACFFILGIIGTIFVSAMDAGLAWMIKPIINQGLIQHDPKFIRLLPQLIIGVFILRGLFVFASNYGIENVGRSVIRDLRQRVF